MKKICSAGLLALFLSLAGATTAKADTVTVGDLTFNGTVTATTVTLTITCNDATCAGWFLGDFTLKGFTFTGGPTDGAEPSGYAVQNGGQNNDAVGNGGGCDSTQPGQAVCWDAPSTLSTQLTNGGTISFSANITGGVPPSGGDFLHVQATGYDNSAGSQTGGGKVFAVSQDLNGTTVPFPEPGTFTMLGAGLLGLAGIARRRILKS
jgi:hypothetical protein